MSCRYPCPEDEVNECPECGQRVGRDGWCPDCSDPVNCDGCDYQDTCEDMPCERHEPTDYELETPLGQRLMDGEDES